MFDNIHEECGVFGIYDKTGRTDVVRSAYYALFALQHRGQESCGIAVNDDGVITLHKDLGLVPEVFDEETLAKLGKAAAETVTSNTDADAVKAVTGDRYVHPDAK